MVFDDANDAFCCSLTRPIWNSLICWLEQNSQKPSLDERLRHFFKAKENAQHFMQQANDAEEDELHTAAAKLQRGSCGNYSPDRLTLTRFQLSP